MSKVECISIYTLDSDILRKNETFTNMRTYKINYLHYSDSKKKIYYIQYAGSPENMRLKDFFYPFIRPFNKQGPT